ncbi:MAG: DNA primase [Prevotellaceae bacterium]|jgi:DNA primase|nr:DNA primase [Prevotellaceae bacterium]
MIDRATIDRIFDAANIVDVVGEFVSLKKRGVNYLACCPFHDEKTPSFSVSATKNIYKCFGCGKGGNVVNFVMEHEHLSYVEALKYLGKKYGIEIKERELTEEEVQEGNRRESLMVVSAYAQEYFSRTLWEQPDGKAIGLSYFHERGFNDNIIKKFQLGYSPDARSAFSNHALRDGYKKEYLVGAGLSIDKGETLIDRFSGRVMFPIHSISGRVIAFGGRTLKQDKTVAKYFNSPESEIYSKSHVLYGIFFAKQAVTRQQKCYLVEGYTDVISMHQAGIENVVASSGTSLTVDQIKLIKRFTPNVTVLYDGDAAGIKASLRGIDMLLEEGLNVKVALLPDGDDPDSFSRKHSASELEAFLQGAEQDFISFKTKLLSDEAKTDPLKRAALITDVVHSIAAIPDNITRTVYVKECSQLMTIEEDILSTEVAKLRRRKWQDGAAKRPAGETPATPPDGDERDVAPAATPQPVFTHDAYHEAAERELVYYLLKFGDRELPLRNGGREHLPVAEYIMSELQKDDLTLINPHHRRLFDEYGKVLELAADDRAKYFFNHPDQQVARLAVDILSDHYNLTIERFTKSEEPENYKLCRDVPHAILSYKSAIAKQRYIEASHRLRDAKPEQDMAPLMAQLQSLQQVRKAFSDELKRLTT